MPNNAIIAAGMNTSDFTYHLPDELIASHPPTERGTTRLLVLDSETGLLKDKHYNDVADYVRPGDVVILNDTKVIPARLMTHKKDSSVVRELILLEKHSKEQQWHEHSVLYRRRLSIGDILVASDESELTVTKLLGDGVARIRSSVDLLELADRVGSVPLPPYMHRAATKEDSVRYQTLWAREAGSVAAPTASLNMTDETLSQMQAHGAEIHYATLHVGLGTFLPIRTEQLSEHVMHKEYFEIPKATVAAIQQARARGRRVFAIGTTVTRTLEYAAPQILSGSAEELHGEADIFMYPGYTFKVVDALLTNFHAPNSTVLMLAAAFAGWDNLKTAYEHAISENYQFLSYGDSMLLHRGLHS
jgi:S-adenosylmethionine:tRNA ribosyltransferase-isomerase